MNDEKLIFRTIVGSQAHGLATPESDFDYRGVFVANTSDLLALGRNVRNTSWVEGNDDDTSWEVGHFLHLATKCNPTILEVFLAPVSETGALGAFTEELRNLFSSVWNSKGVRDAFIGYSHNQRKKMFDKEDPRPHKYGAAYLRVLYTGAELLRTGTFTMRISDTPIGEFIKRVKAKDPAISIGCIIDKCEELERDINLAYSENPNKETDIEKVNDFLLRVRQSNW